MNEPSGALKWQKLAAQEGKMGLKSEIAVNLEVFLPKLISLRNLELMLCVQSVS